MLYRILTAGIWIASCGQAASVNKGKKSISQRKCTERASAALELHPCQIPTSGLGNQGLYNSLEHQVQQVEMHKDAY